jgi:four helix bundle protein
VRDYTKIQAWQLADDSVVAVYEVTKRFPREEVYGITSQVRRAASSAAANIVEGSARESLKDYLHFLQIARGSLAEAQYFLHLARRLGYVSDSAYPELVIQCKRTFACLQGLMQAVQKEAAR